MDILTILFLVSIFSGTYLLICIIMALIQAIVKQQTLSFAIPVLAFCTCVTYNCWYLFVKGL